MEGRRVWSRDGSVEAGEFGVEMDQWKAGKFGVEMDQWKAGE